MYKYRNADGSRNQCGNKIAILRKSLPERTSQQKLAAKLQLEGVDLNKNAIQRIESGQRFVTDLELLALAKVLHTTVDALLK